MAKKLELVKSFDGDEVTFMMEKMDFDAAISICGKGGNKYGHSTIIQFRATPLYSRLAEIILPKDKRFQTISDVHRTMFLLGAKELWDAVFKGKRKVGDELDDALMAIRNLQDSFREEDMAITWMQTVKSLKSRMAVYRSDRKEFDRVVSKKREEIENMNHPFFRKKILKEFDKAVEDIKGELFGGGVEEREGD